MRLDIEGGFIDVKKTKMNKIQISIGCDHFYPNGVRKETVVNTSEITEEELVDLFSDIFPKNIEENNED